MTSSQLPPKQRALVCQSTNTPLAVETIPNPKLEPGTAVIQILAAPILAYAREIYNGELKYPFPTPIVAGTGGIGRVAAVGPEASKLQVGQLVNVDCFLISRDDSEHRALHGIFDGFTPNVKKIMSTDLYRHGCCQEYVRAPLENCEVLSEDILCKNMGYTFEALSYLLFMMVPFGGLRDIKLQPGETVLVAPATGPFSSAAVVCALAMGAARVIAMGRNEDSLAKCAKFGDRVRTVKMAGNVDTEVAAIKAAAGGDGRVDAYLDITPRHASTSTHIKSGILAVGHGGRISLMGGLMDDYALPFWSIMHGDKTIKGKWMYEREDVKALIRLIETGLLKLEGQAGQVAGPFKLDEWSEAFDAAAKRNVGEVAVIDPRKT